MADWADLQKHAPTLATAGARLLGMDGAAIGFLATAGRDGHPRVAPVCPIVCDGRIYVSVPPATPKRRDLAETGRYVLHAFLGPDDEEFAITGHAVEVRGEEERAAVHAAIRFGSFHREHPIFRLTIESCHWVRWEDAGLPTTRRLVQRWRATGRS